MSLSITFTINGIRRTVELEDPRVTLLDLLRERLDLTGTKKGATGASAVHARSCSTDAASTPA